MKRFNRIVIASALALTTILTPTLSYAQWRGGPGYRGVAVPHGGWGYRGGWGYNRGGWGWGAPLAAGLIGGLVLGGIAASSPYRYGYGYGYPAYPYGGPPAYGYGSGYYGPAYNGRYYGRPPAITRNSSCSDVRARPSLYSESVWASCGLVSSGYSDWTGVVR